MEVTLGIELETPNIMNECSTTDTMSPVLCNVPLSFNLLVPRYSYNHSKIGHSCLSAGTKELNFCFIFKYVTALLYCMT